MLPWAEQALAISPQDVAFLVRRADALYLLGRYRECVDVWNSLPVEPNRLALRLLRLGMSTMMTGDLLQALSLLDTARQRALTHEPTLITAIEFTLGEAMLKAGRADGFPLWLMRNAVPHLTACYCPQGIPTWNGTDDVRGKRVLVTHQLGFGDNFLLLACVQTWLEAGAKIVLTCNADLLPLMRASLPQCDVIGAVNPSHSNAPLPAALQAQVEHFNPDLHATLLHLPVLQSQQPPRRGPFFTPYIQPPALNAQVAEAWAQHLRAQHPGKKLVGIFWDCVQRHWSTVSAVVRCWAKRRSLPLDCVNDLILPPAVSDAIHFVALHHPAAAALAGMPAGNISVYTPGIRDFSDTAACMAQLDAVIAVDSGIANLAAMMGVKTCVPTHTAGDWRWGSAGTSTPWLHNVTVFRQTQEGEWGAVVSDIHAWLQEI
ncbi:hypothetical protein CIG19_10440 [Enterobacterales bacterium CwR94]|nr:hypothetical protein CIG19_10440 [Enterobacterales bacterium CwR94]